MRAVSIILAVCLAAAFAVPRNPQRIVGGNVTDIANWPYATAVLRRVNPQLFTQWCGGTILTSTAILTATHCFPGHLTHSLRVRVGSTNANSGGVVHDIRLLILHPAYNPITLDNDVAVLRTQTNIVFNSNVQPGSIAGAEYNLADNEVVWTVGWGQIYDGGPHSEQLREVQIWTVNQAVCRNRYGSGSPITDNMLCAGYLDVGGRDSCVGDSGGPLFHHRIVVGITSFGHDCGNPRYPGVYARVSRFTAWIEAAAT